MAKYLLRLCFLLWVYSDLQAQHAANYLLDVEALAAANKSLTYQELMHYYHLLEGQDPRLQVVEAGPTDGYDPLHTVIIDQDRDFDPSKSRSRDKLIILINNGIHPGEPDGMDASLWFVQDLLADKYPGMLQHIVFVVIPVYNIEGALERNSKLRFTQNGPESYGFRGNGQRLDLNRDFIKCDSRNAQTFSRLYTHWDPDVLIDNHVSDGADYQHVMTLLATQPDKLGYQQGDYLRYQYLPALYRSMEEKGFPMSPYVNVWGTTPDQGLPGFMDTPRYASGYSTLFNAYGFVPETHMLKPYLERVQATRALMECISAYAAAHSAELIRLRTDARRDIAARTQLPVSWTFDKSRADTVRFSGYASEYVQSLMTGLPRLRYDRNKPYQKKLPYFNYAIPGVIVDVPETYAFPQGWYRVLERLELNGVRMTRLQKDTTLKASAYVFDKVHAPATPYEGHYSHYNTELHTVTGSYTLRKGDYLIPTAQRARRFIVETLEPQASDSYFVWNFFDAVLNRKEGFNDYVWEDRMAAELKRHPDWKDKLNAWLAEHPEAVHDGFAQLNYLYQISDYSEPWANQYPVLKIFK